MDSKEHTRLYDALLSMETREEMRGFLDDLCTIQEINSLAQRYEMARLLKQGFTYAQIAEKTGASTATISRVNRCLVYGAGGYRTALKRCMAEEETK